jgi:solute carrier family 25 uncoupling protein 8/9
VIVAQPTDVVKVRMQANIGYPKRYPGTMIAYKIIGQQEGVRGLWRGAIPNITRNAVVNAAELVSYDLIKTQILRNQLMSDNLPCHFVSAFCAGFITTIFASPVDVIKTRIMNSSPGQYKSILHAVTTMYKEAGFFGFYKGFVPNYMRLGTWNIAMFVLFEQFKRGLTHALLNDDTY